MEVATKTQDGPVFIGSLVTPGGSDVIWLLGFSRDLSASCPRSPGWLRGWKRRPGTEKGVDARGGRIPPKLRIWDDRSPRVDS